MQKTKLEDIGDVLDWALSQLGVSGLCWGEGECVCDADDICCSEIPLDCALAKTRVCPGPVSDEGCCADCSGTAGNICYEPYSYFVPDRRKELDDLYGNRDRLLNESFVTFNLLLKNIDFRMPNWLEEKIKGLVYEIDLWRKCQ